MVSTGPRASEAFPTPRRAGCTPAGHQQLASTWFPQPRGPERNPPRLRGCWLSPRAQHRAWHRAENHQCDLKAQMRPDRGWCNSGRPDPTRKRSGLLHSWHWAAGRQRRQARQAAWGPGAPLPVGRGPHSPAPQPPRGPGPASAALGPVIRGPGASLRTPRHGRRRRGSDSPRAGGNPPRSPRAARCWRPGPWQRPGFGAGVPNPSADSPSRRSITSALSRGR